MFATFYHKYKVAFWSVLTLLFAAGSISNFYTGASWEVALNAIFGLICLIVTIGLLIKRDKK